MKTLRLSGSSVQPSLRTTWPDEDEGEAAGLAASALARPQMMPPTRTRATMISSGQRWTMRDERRLGIDPPNRDSHEPHQRSLKPRILADESRGRIEKVNRERLIVSQGCRRQSVHTGWRKPRDAE